MTINNISRVRSLSLPLFAAKADLLLLWSISGWNQYVLTNQHFFPFCYLFCIPPGNWHVLPAVRRHWRRRGRGVDPVNPFFSVNFIPSDPMSGGVDWQNRPPPSSTSMSSDGGQDVPVSWWNSGVNVTQIVAVWQILGQVDQNWYTSQMRIYKTNKA